MIPVNSKNLLQAHFKKKSDMDKAIVRLLNLGFSKSDITTTKKNALLENFFSYKNNSKSEMGFTIGFLLGSAIGAVLSLILIEFYYLESTMMFMLKDYPSMIVFIGLAAGGGVGGVLGLVLGKYFPQLISKSYPVRTTAGGFLMSVHSSSFQSAEKAKVSVSASGGTDITTLREI